MITFKLHFTTTRILSFLIFFGGIAVAIILEDKEPFIEGIMWAGILQGTKQASDAYKSRFIKDET